MVLKRILATAVLLAAALVLNAGRAAELDIVTGRIYTELLAHPSEMDDVRNLGAKMIRVAFEDHADPAQLTLYKDVVALAKSRGIGVMGLLDPNSAPWGDPTTSTYRDAYVDSVLWHIKNVPDVKAWEIWNEPENFGFQADPSRYAPLMVQTYERVSAARASGEIPADVLLVCAGVVDTRMAKIVFDAPEMRAYRAAHDGQVPFDVANYHPYSTGDPWDSAPAHPNGFREGMNFATWFNTITSMKGSDGYLLFGTKPFWFTEFGFSTSNFGLLGARTALLHMAESMRAFSRIQKAFWYDYHDDVETYGLRLANATLTEAAGTKHVYYAFAGEAAGVGIRRNGTNVTPTVYETLVDTYNAKGGVPVVGLPAMGQKSAEVEALGTGVLQRFAGGSAGAGLIALSSANGNVPLWVYGRLLSAYDAAGGPAGALGYPVSDRHAYLGHDRQNTAAGLLLDLPVSPVGRLIGDVDGNGTATRGDTDLALRAALGLETPSPDAIAVADLYPRTLAGRLGDGILTVLDIVRGK